MDNIILRILTVFCFLIMYIYWHITAYTAEKSKPKNKEGFSIIRFSSGKVLFMLEVLILTQFVGYNIWKIPNASFLLSFLGLLMTLAGLAICLIARKTLGDNWTNAYEYQVKKNHDLITTGIYAIIRHPIYCGLTLMLIGAEMVAQSYLFISFFAFFVAFYFQGRREEKILLAHFGQKYQDYMQRTKMLIPFVL